MPAKNSMNQAQPPDDIATYLNTAAWQMQQGRYQEASESYGNALLLNPDSRDILYDLGIALRLQGDHVTAIYCNQRVLELDPTYINAYDNLCDSYISLKNHGALAETALKAIQLDKHHANGYYHLGIACIEQGDLPAGRDFLERAAALNPHNNNILNTLGLACLASGDLARGWQGYERRWFKETMPVQMQHLNWPHWLGESGQVIYVWAEQGIGDQIMLASMLGDLIARSKKVIFSCAKKLLPLIRRSFPTIEVLDLADPQAIASVRDQIEVQCALGSLARWLRPDVASFPRADHFLVPDQARVQYWQQRLGAMGEALNVGICWRSANLSGDRQFYSALIEQWQPILAVPGVRFINLQYDECSAELASVRQKYGIAVQSFPEVDLFNDLDETAALTQALDLVISAPTAVGILAAAIGVPAWVTISGFYWQNFGTAENCWYGHMTTVHRSWEQPWEITLNRVAAMLKSLVSLPQTDHRFEAALLLHNQGQVDQARELYQAILQVHPDHAASLHYLGVMAYQQQNHAEAIRLMQRSIALDPTKAKYYSNLSNVYAALGDDDQACACLMTALQLQPDFADACLNLSAVLMKQERIVEAREYAARAVELSGHNPRAHDNLGVILLKQLDLQGAIQCHQRAIELDPSYAPAHTNLAAAYLKTKNFVAAAASCMTALALDQNNAKSYLYLGMACEGQGNLEQAESFMQHALHLAPDDYLTQWNLSLLLLGTGKLEAGWKHYEARWHLEHVLPVRRLDFPYPWWDGSAMSNKTIFVWWEQGIGDQIMFAGMLTELIPRFKKCIVACPPKLRALYTRSFPHAHIISNTDEDQFALLKGEIDVQSPLGSLARWLRPTVASFPQQRYLVPASDRVAYWQDRLAELGPGLKVGICWRSGNMAADRRFYWAQLEEWAPIFALGGIVLVNLQYDDCAAELASITQQFGVKVHAFAEVDLFDDLDETAALTRALDLVIAIPTTSGILAAALGVPSWMLFSGFSWQKFGTDRNCWYANARHLERRWELPWAEFLIGVAADLRALVDSSASPVSRLADR